jgi:hypothetical protein
MSARERTKNRKKLQPIEGAGKAKLSVHLKKLNSLENYLIGKFNINEILKCHSQVP